MKRCVVTGGAGFIGSSLTRRLVAEGVRVRVVDNLSTRSLANLARLERAVDFVEGDVRDSEVYGGASTLPLREETPPRPLSPYAATKRCGEDYCRVFSELFGLDTVALRYFNVFGPRHNPAAEHAAVIPKFVLAAFRGENRSSTATENSRGTSSSSRM